MKVQVKNTNKSAFNPVTLVIEVTIESQRELSQFIRETEAFSEHSATSNYDDVELDNYTDIAKAFEQQLAKL